MCVYVAHNFQSSSLKSSALFEILYEKHNQINWLDHLINPKRILKFSWRKGFSCIVYVRKERKWVWLTKYMCMRRTENRKIHLANEFINNNIIQRARRRMQNGNTSSTAIHTSLSLSLFIAQFMSKQ